MLNLAILSVFIMLGAGVYATQSESPSIRAIGKTLCVLSTLSILLGIAVVCWVIVALELTW